MKKRTGIVSGPCIKDDINNGLGGRVCQKMTMIRIVFCKSDDEIIAVSYLKKMMTSFMNGP